MIDYNFTDSWLNTHNIVLEKSFVAAIRNLAATYKKNPEIIPRKFTAP